MSKNLMYCIFISDYYNTFLRKMIMSTVLANKICLNQEKKNRDRHANCLSGGPDLTTPPYILRIL